MLFSVILELGKTIWFYFFFSLTSSPHPGTISPGCVICNSPGRWHVPAVVVHRQSKSEHTKDFSRAYWCGDVVVNPIPDWLDLLPVRLPGGAGADAGPEEQMCWVWRHRCSSPWKETLPSGSSCSFCTWDSQCLWSK